jgi:hypothetical protein
MIVCGLEANICRFVVVYTFIYVLLLEFQLSGGGVLDPITNFNHATLLCLCQGRNLISNSIWRGRSSQAFNEISKCLNDRYLRKPVDTIFVERFKMGGGCLLYTYWWNWQNC